ncbi:hypothetical protein [Desulfohalovibrio reitneri]|uniref:hypothetical protein n=1 Tax=Desulfohalovibrio reitneri TaxID=1307759 RepID=UPI0004A735E3|nr:hypothetical protein [Desulfohalovibrio reitneri]
MPFTSGDAWLAANAIPLSFNLLLVMSALGMPLLAAVNETKGRAKGGVLARKCAQHLSRLGLWTALFTVLVAGGAVVMLVTRTQTLTGEIAPVFAPLLLPLLGVWLLAALAYDLSWKRLKSTPGTHLGLGWLAALCGLGGLFVFQAFLSAASVPLHAEQAAAPSLATLLPPPGTDFFWPLTVGHLLLAPACASALAPAYVLLRRPRDDWGRDYYAQSLRRLAGLSLLFMPCYLAAHGWLVWKAWQAFGQALTTPALLWPWLAGAAACVAACVLWRVVCRAENPLRHKIWIWFALLLLWAGLAAFTFSGLRLLFLAL